VLTREEELSDGRLPLSESRHIFLSYRSTEVDFALKLAADLKNAGVNLWMDRFDISPGEDWRKSLEAAVYSCAAMISILSPSYVGSKYCKRELGRADRLGRPIFPVIIGKIDEQQWPLEIEREQYIDFSNWNDDAGYRQKLNLLVDVLKESFSDQISVIPDPETQYLTNLVAELETRRGLTEYLEFSSDTDKAPGREFMRPEPRYTRISARLSSFAVLHDTLKFDQFPSQFQEYPYHKRIVIKEIDEILAKYPRFMLTSDGGGGKTMALRHLVLDAIANYQVSSSHAPLPLLLDFMSWDAEMDLGQYIRACWPLDTDPIKLAARGKVTIFIDGLCENGPISQAQIAQIRDWLASDLSPQKLVVTCRSSENFREPDLGLPVVHIQQMGHDQIEHFVNHYLGEDIAPILLNQILPRNTWQDMHKQYLYELARNPFLLSAMVLIHKSSDYADIPENLGMLLKRLVQEIWLRENGDYRYTDLSLPELETALADLAFNAIAYDIGVNIPYGFAYEHLGSDTLIHAAIELGFLQQRGAYLRFEYDHLKHYFAALALHKNNFLERLELPQIGRGGVYIAGKWDLSVTILSGILPDPDHTLMQIAQQNPFLALKCIASGLNVAETTVDPLIGELIQVAHTPGQDLRVGTARVLATINTEMAVPILLSAMRTGEWDVRWAATLAFWEMEIPLLPGLSETLEEMEHDVQDAAYLAVRRLSTNALPTLIKHLQSASGRTRRSAAWALGHIADRSAVPGLVHNLYDEDNLVSSAAAQALGRIRDNAAISWLLEILYHSNWRVRKSAAHALGSIGQPALPTLFNALQHGEEDVRRLAIEALREIETDDSTSTLIQVSYDLSPDVRGAAVDALEGRDAPEVVERLIDCLEDTVTTNWNQKRICDIAARILANNGTEYALAALEQWQKTPFIPMPTQKGPDIMKKTASTAKERLSKITTEQRVNPGDTVSIDILFESEDWRSRQKAVQMLAQDANNPVAILMLMRALSDKARPVRLAAVKGLISRGSDEALQALLKGLVQTDAATVKPIQDYALRLGQRTVPFLLELLNHENPLARARSAKLLGQLQAAAAVPELLKHRYDLARAHTLDQNVGEVVNAALKNIGSPDALAALGIQPDEALPAPHPASSPTLSEPQPEPATIETEEPTEPVTISHPQQRILTDLLRRLRHAEWGDRENAAKALREYAHNLKGVRDAHTQSQLQHALQSTDWVVRWAVIEALAWIGDPAAVPAVRALLDDENWTVQIAATRALAEIGDQTAASHILPLTKHDNSVVREAAAEALGVLGHTATVPHLCTLLSDRDSLVRLAATVALGKFKDDSLVLQHLLHALEDENGDVRWAATEALLAKENPQSVPALARHLDDQGGPYWEDDRVGQLAFQALTNIGTEEAESLLQAWQGKQTAQTGS
jgi:HEAT repeat protein